MTIIIANPHTGALNLEPDHARVKFWVRYLQNERSEHVEHSLRRAEPHIASFRREFRAAGVPTALVWLPLIESGFRSDVVSPKSAVGMFQFRESTARAFGLSVSQEVDERLDPIRSARACASYLSYLCELFGSWEVALAAYVAGEGSVKKWCPQYDTLAWPAIASQLPAEVRDYVYKIKASALVAHARIQRLRDQVNSGQTHHVIIHGETYSSIARKYDVAVDVLLSANKIDARKLRTGDRLLIPSSSD